MRIVNSANIVDLKLMITQKQNKNFLVKLPLILAIISIVISIVEVLSTPMIMGLNSIIISGLISVIGGNNRYLSNGKIK